MIHKAGPKAPIFMVKNPKQVNPSEKHMPGNFARGGAEPTDSDYHGDMVSWGLKEDKIF